MMACVCWWPWTVTGLDYNDCIGCCSPDTGGVVGLQRTIPVCMYIYISLYIYIYVCVCIYIYIYTYTAACQSHETMTEKSLYRLSSCVPRATATSSPATHGNPAPYFMLVVAPHTNAGPIRGSPKGPELGPPRRPRRKRQRRREAVRAPAMAMKLSVAMAGLHFDKLPKLYMRFM